MEYFLDANAVAGSELVLEGDELIVESIYVNTGYRSEGIGGQLLDVVEQIAREHQISTIKGLLAGPKRFEDRLRFAKRHGFKQDLGNKHLIKKQLT